ncbi:tho complex subunit 1 [Plakobranchus ocellatus]|uniref:Tho complex subunit 1 n=1 Tax=Plakobranchus ocellatus TaxID=259542 RepID=A0AAV3ZHB3_9GAST|nr:tho complex subunit 1 [Plakobranchus ocellatus]
MAAPTSYPLEFDKARKQFKGILQKSLEANEVEGILSFVESYQDEVGLEKRAVLDQVFRDILCKMIASASEAECLKSLITFAVQAVKQDMCSPSTPFLMMADIFDMLTIERCEDIFDLVEDKVTIWKSETFYESGKNYLLRMCNDLIRRLSKSQNTVFCGRIQLFLSRLFPLSEKSALNLASQFNLENVTVFSKREDSEKKEDGPSSGMEVDSVSDQPSSIPIDYHLYSKFWALQDFFRRPTQCYDKSAWDTFAQYAKDVLAIFSSYKLDDTSSSSKKPTAFSQQQTQQQVQNFFAKYLTSEKWILLPELISLGVSDPIEIDEDYTRLREQHVSQQRLRSQSVDPSSQRHVSSTSITSSSWERSSPFQPYGSSSHIQRQPGLSHKDFYWSQQDRYREDDWDRPSESQSDPRRLHPAGVAYRQDTMGLDYRGNKQYFSQSDQEEGKRPLAKAVLSRAEYIQQLRSLYQERHKQRQGVYPLDDAEEKYERQIQEMERRKMPPGSGSLHDSPRDPNLLRFTDRPPSRQLEQHRSERTASSSSTGNSNNNFHPPYGVSGSGGGRGGDYSQYYYEYNNPSSVPLNRSNSRGAYESSYYHQQNFPSHSSHHYHPHQQQQHSYQQHGYEYSQSYNYKDYKNSEENSTTSYRRPSYESYRQDQFYKGPPQAYRSAPSQYLQHRSTTPYSDPTSAKV